MPQDVLDAYEGIQAAVYEDGLDGTGGVGFSGGVADVTEDDTPDRADQIIADLDILGDDLALDPKFSNGRLFIGAKTKTALLVSLPVEVAPAKLKRDQLSAAKALISTHDEFECAGGPMTGDRPGIGELRAAAREAGTTRQLQRTTGSVDRVRYTTNPLTGCWHGRRGVSCYAENIAHRLFPQGFVPTLYPARLDHFENTTVPDVSDLERGEAWRERSVFCVSMGDLFGKWVPAWYVELVLDEIRQHPGWFVFLLTEDPDRLADFTFPKNAAVGATITGEGPHHRSVSAGEQARLYRRQAAALAQVEGAAFTSSRRRTSWSGPRKSRFQWGFR